MTKPLLSALALGLALLASVPASAQTMGQPAMSSMPAADATLYQALGERAGIEKIVAGLLQRATADARISAQFKDTNLPQLQQRLVDQVCALSGGPCRYTGADMKTAHANLDIRKADFNALVEDLQASMDANGVPFGAQTRLLALLAPMHRDVVNTR